MQDIPDKATLLGAVRRFLKSDLASTIDDPALRFRVLIAANLLGVVSRELELEHDHHLAEVTRLASLLEGLDVEALSDLHGDTQRREALSPLYARLLEETDSDEAALFSHVKQTLAEKLEVVNPRFDLSPSID